MLVLTRKTNEQIRIGDEITITILRVKGQAIRIGIEAPRTMRVVRSELPPLVDSGTVANLAASGLSASEHHLKNCNLELSASIVSASGTAASASPSSAVSISAATPAIRVRSHVVSPLAKSRARQTGGKNPGELAAVEHMQPLAAKLHARRAPSAVTTPLIR